mgnify:FL=1|jgi:hypothetical protein
MNATELDSKAAPFAWVAARDAAMKSYAASTLYTDIQKVRAERMKLGLEMVYSARSAFITYRKKFVTIKLDQARVRDRKTLALLEQDYTAQGDVTKVITDQGITYRIARG